MHKMENNSLCFSCCWIYVFICVLLSITQVDCNDQRLEKLTGTGLKCYACYQIGPGNICERYDSYQRAWTSSGGQDGPVTLKTCTPPYDKTCMIETFTSDKGVTAQIRDCSNNKTFDFTQLSPYNSTAFLNLTHLADNNITSCESGVCLTKCGPPQFADFCNGPQLNGTHMPTGGQDRLSVNFNLVCVWLTALFVSIINS